MKNKTAIITGGGRGIGRAISIKFAKLGANIVINYAGNATAAEETAKECEKFGVSAITVKGDVSNAADCEALVEEAMAKFGSVDILVNNAGITKDALLMRMSEEDFDSVIDINLKGSFLMMKAVCRQMMKQKYGRIINMASIAGLMGNAGQVNYSASKAGIIGMTRSFSKEIAAKGVTVNAVAPGFIKTDMTSVLSEKVVEEMLKTIPTKTLGEPEDVAGLVAFLASEETKYITGQVISINGGML